MFPKVGIKYALVIVLVTLFSGLNACTSPAIYNDPDFNPPAYWGSHTVREGDTLYAIAWRYGRDVSDLARRNGLQSPYLLRPGQKINLAVDPDYITPRSSGSSASEGTLVSSATGKKTTTPATTYKKKQKATPRVTSVSSGKVPSWQWPHSGPIIDTYSSTGRINKGIDIAGKVGDPVVAASDGEVVYAGSGLIGYGPLVILNHNEEFLSAYAHNHRILVKEGDRVSRGEQITELGSEGTNRPKLHFEIRRLGKPVDPMKYLPAR